jgi:hypothetical protein
MKVQRKFAKWHKERLVAFANRILKNTINNTNFSVPESYSTNLESSIDQLVQTMKDTIPYRKDYPERVKAAERLLIEALQKIADWIDSRDMTKSDIQMSGFTAKSPERLKSVLNE